MLLFLVPSALLDRLLEVRVLHGGRHALLVVDLLRHLLLRLVGSLNQVQVYLEAFGRQLPLQLYPE